MEAKTLFPWRVLAAALVVFLVSSAVHAATVSGTVTFPVSDAGYVLRVVGAKVRVQGTTLTTSVVENSGTYSGTFSLTNVPTGPITLVLEEPLASGGVIGDRFTQDSKRVEIMVSGDVSGVEINPVHHWRNLPSYPPPYQNAAYDIWEPHFVSPDVGFMGFQNRGTNPYEFELWRTTNGAESWQKIGHWIRGTSDMYPDILNPSMLFIDADHGVMRGGGSGTAWPPHLMHGVIRTSNGGLTWEYIDLPNAPPVGDLLGGNGIVSITRYAAINATHWIICGSENVGSYMGSGTPGWITIWETEDAGATWHISSTVAEAYGSCTALGAHANGLAFAFDTGGDFGNNRYLFHRDTAGVWTLQQGNWSDPEGNDLVVYGDAPIVGDTAWVSGRRWLGHSVTESGVYRSRDGGITWTRISDSLLQYFDFANTLRGHATAGGPAYISYDSGQTWRFQAQGGGVSGHGNYMFAFGPTDVFWKDGGVGDPNGKSDVQRYFEQASPNLEVLKGTGVTDSMVNSGTKNVPVAAFRITSWGLTDVLLQPLRVRASGSGNDQSEIDLVTLWWDRDEDGAVTIGDTALSTTVFGADNGIAELGMGDAAKLHQLYPRQLLVTYDLSIKARDGRTFSASLAPATVEAFTADETTTRVVATAPSGTVITGATITNVLPPATSVTLTPNPASPALVGTPVTFTAAASGGSGSYEYMFLLRVPGGTLDMMQAYSATPTWAWNTSGAVAGTYQVVVRARSAGSAKGYETYQSISYAVTFPPASSVTLTPNPASPASVGTPVTFTAAASGGSGSYEYMFLLRAPGGTLDPVQAYSSTPTWNWNTTGVTTGTYQVVVRARNAGSTRSYETYQSISYAVTFPPASSVTLTPNPASPASVGTPVTFTAAASGGSGSYEYMFLLRVPGGTLDMMQAYSATPTWAWNTSGAVAGTYQVVVRARSAGSAKGYETYQSISYAVTFPPASSVTLTPNPASPASVGTPVTFTAAASGGSGSYEYMFLLRAPGGTLDPVQAYSSTPTWNWNTTGVTTGTYQVVVRARNAGSTKSYETYAWAGYALTTP
jgi:hypothetical protein